MDRWGFLAMWGEVMASYHAILSFVRVYCLFLQVFLHNQLMFLKYQREIVSKQRQHWGELLLREVVHVNRSIGE